jgi:hypothetical protein
MLRSIPSRSLLVALGAFLIASCSDPSVTAPPVFTDAAATQVGTPTSAASSKGSKVVATGLELRAVWWRKNHKDVIRVSKTIDQAGGTISIPATGLTVLFPAGAVSAPITITITSDDKYVAYKMEPSGTRFLKDVTVTQLLNTTAIFGEPLRSQLYAAYIADDNIKLSGKVPALEIEPSTTIFSTLNPLLPQAQVWIIRHFSRYMLASD